MNTPIDPAPEPAPRKSRQWLWFVALWCGGLAAALTLGGVIKLLMAFIR